MTAIPNSTLVIANWKSHKNSGDVESWLSSFTMLLKSFNPAVAISIAPTFPRLPLVDQWIESQKNDQVSLAIQDVSSFPAGAYTGAVSTYNLKDFEITYAIVGHSERRRYFHETHIDVGNKVDQAIQAGIIPIVCVDDEYIRAQAAAIAPDQLKQCIVAYEPLEAIGTGHNQAVSEVESAVKLIKDVFGENTRVIYGGSVAAENVKEYVGVVGGFLVGTKSLHVEEFAALVRAVG